MGLQKFSIRVFIGSPNDLSEERILIKNLISRMNSEFIPHDIEFEPFDYHDLSPALGNPQKNIDEYIKRSDLVILLFGYRLGEGTLAEYRLATNLYNDKNGRLQNLMMYFKEIPEDIDLNKDIQKVVNFKKEIQHKLLFHEFKDSVDLENKLTKHLRLWLGSQMKFINIYKEHHLSLDQTTIATMKVSELPYSDDILKIRENFSDNQISKLGRKALKEYFSPNPQLTLKDLFLIAKYLYNSIRENDYEVCRHKQFIYPIH